MKLTTTKKITLTKAEYEVLTRFEETIDEMDLNAEEIESLLFNIYRGRGSDDYGTLIEYDEH